MSVIRNVFQINEKLKDIFSDHGFPNDGVGSYLEKFIFDFFLTSDSSDFLGDLWLL